MAAPEVTGWTQGRGVLDVVQFGSLAILYHRLADVDSEDFKRYYPTSTLVAEIYDIISFWVSRMIFKRFGIYSDRHSKMP